MNIEQIQTQRIDQAIALCEKLITKNELLKANLRTAADQLRSGVSKIQQKTMARVIEQVLNESN